ncbi:hypothetical protein ACFQ1Q_11005 [Winogradskyella litorisediminis]|uniref:Lipocalin-like domain-containing protein n=1 Tax=Winogradskyella litorisediminis TaxID=1156618 RepID=A0ABW3N7W9_9FLAO
MKKILSLLCVFLLCSAFQCDDEPLEGEFVTDTEAACQIASLNTAEAALAFLAADDENYTEICTNYRATLEAQIIACGDADGSLQAIIEELGDCVNNDNPNDAACQTAIAAKNEAEAQFNASTDANYTETCNALKLAIQAVIDECGTTAELQSQLDGLGNCILTTNPETIEGTWLLTAWNGTEPIDLNNDGEESINFLDEMDCYNNETFVFNNDGTGNSISTSYADIEIFLDPNNSEEFDFTVDCILEDETTPFTWTQSGNIVTTTDAFGTFDWTLVGNTLSTTIPEGFTVINTDDATVNTIQDLTFVYTKQ